MASIVLKKSSVAARVPVVGDLVYGELALNYADGALYYKRSDNTVQNLIPSVGTSLIGTTSSSAPYTITLGQSAGTGSTGTGNIAFGYQALDASNSGGFNFVAGYQAATNSVNASDIIAIGTQALFTPTGGGGANGVYIGYRTGYAVTFGGSHVLIGYSAGKAITSSNADVAIGYEALSAYNGPAGENVAIGANAGNTLTAGGNNIIIGAGAQASSFITSNEITIGKSAHTRFRFWGALMPGGTSAGTIGQVLTSQGPDTTPIWTTLNSGGVGTVTSVDISVPTGLSVSNTPITNSGTIAITLTSGYSIPTTADQTNWSTAYSWGDHASAGYQAALVSGTTIKTINGTSLLGSGNISTSSTRVVLLTDATSITINCDTTDLAKQTNTQATGTLTINAPTGTPVDGQRIMLRLTTTNTQTFSWNAAFLGSTDIVLPTTSSGAGKEDYLGFIYDSVATKWHLIAKSFGY